MVKFLLILLIFTKIIEIIYAGENEAGTSKNGKDKRKLDEYLEQNSSNYSNESSDELISNPYADWLREGMLLSIRNDQSSKLWTITNNENIQNSLPRKQKMMNQIIPMQGPTNAKEGIGKN